MIGIPYVGSGPLAHSLALDKVVAKMVGEEPATSLTPDVKDGIGEIINMIAGQAKSQLANTKYHFTFSIPTTVSGAGHEINHRQGTPNIAVLFEADGEEFIIQVCLSATEGT